jgi:hypothetical protein
MTERDLPETECKNTSEIGPDMSRNAQTTLKPKTSSINSRKTVETKKNLMNKRDTRPIKSEVKNDLTNLLKTERETSEKHLTDSRHLNISPLPLEPITTAINGPNTFTLMRGSQNTNLRASRTKLSSINSGGR